MTAEEQRVLWKLEGQFDDLKQRVNRMDEKLDRIDTTLSQATGGWRMLLAVGGAGGGVATFLSWLLGYLTFRPGP